MGAGAASDGLLLGATAVDVWVEGPAIGGRVVQPVNVIVRAIIRARSELVRLSIGFNLKPRPLIYSPGARLVCGLS